MTKGSYAVGNNTISPRRKDTSYRSFICVLLIFLAICLIILLASINWGKSSDKPSRTEVEEVETFNNQGFNSNKTFEKIIENFTTDGGPKETEIFYKTPKKTTTTTAAETATRTGEGLNSITSSTTPPTRRTHSETTLSMKQTTLDHLIISSDTSKSPIEDTTLSKLLTTLTSQKIIEQDVNISQEEVTLSKLNEQGTTFFEREETTVPQKLSSSGEEQEIISTRMLPLVTESSDGNINEEGTETTEINSATLFDNLEDNSTTSSVNSTTATFTKLEKISSHFPLETATEAEEIILSEKSTTRLSESKNAQLRLSSFKASSKQPQNTICHKSVCNEAATYILSLMNHTADPCEDFYEFACGGIGHISEDSSIFPEELFEQLNINNNTPPSKYLIDFQRFYRSCLEYEDDFKYIERMEKVEELLGDVGRFQFENDTNDLEYNLTDLVTKLILRQSMPLFDVSVDVDRLTSNLIFQLTLPEQSYLRTSLDNWSGMALHQERCLKKQQAKIQGTYINLDNIYESYNECHNDYGNYIETIDRVVRQFKAFSNLTSEERKKEIKEIRFKIEFQILDKLSQFLAPGEIVYQFINKEYDVRKVSDLQVQYPVLEWKTLFKNLVGHDIPETTIVQVYFGKYFNEIFKSLGQIEFRILNNVFLSIYAHDLFVNTVTPKAKVNRGHYCSDLSKKLMPDIWSYLVKSTTPQELEIHQNKIITNLFIKLRDNFCKSLQSVDWLDDDSKLIFTKKCNSLNVLLFTSPEDEFLMDSYQGVNITEDYQTNLVKLLVHFRRSIYATVGLPLSDKIIFSYFLDPLGKKVMSSYSSNLIAVPPGLIRKAPIGLPSYLTMARIGLKLARQIARYFDPTGIKYWIKLSSTAETAYSSLVSVTTTPLYTSSPRIFQNKNISFAINGSLSTNEKFVDNTGFRLIFDTYSSKQTATEKLPWISSTYSKDKIFFVAVAQEFCQRTSILDFMLEVAERRHLPPVLRVENIMINSEAFTKEFSCSEGAGMNPPIDKIQFPYLPPTEEYGNYEERK